MTKEQLLQRREMLKNGLEKLKCDMNATEGGIQECEFWIKVIEEEEQEQTSLNAGAQLEGMKLGLQLEHKPSFDRNIS